MEMEKIRNVNISQHIEDYFYHIYTVIKFPSFKNNHFTIFDYPALRAVDICWCEEV